MDLETLIPPRRLAAAARALQPRLRELVGLRADAIEGELAERFGCVTWDRVRLIGQAQQRLDEIRDERFASLGGGGAVVIERADQPLECLPTAWRCLRRGQPVVVQLERGALRAGAELLQRMSRSIGPALRVCEADEARPADAAEWRVVGVEAAKTRVAVVQPDADPEVAAYLLARACLRRTGTDPRAVHRVVVVGARPRLERHLRRLWLGARMGPPDDSEAFAGPVRTELASAYRSALEAWTQVPGCSCLVEGGPLVRPTDSSEWSYLAPALFRVRSAEVIDRPPPTAGPLLVLEEVEEAALDRHLRAMADGERGTLWLRFGRAQPGHKLGPEDRQIEGALLVEQLPPGLPAPRP